MNIISTSLTFASVQQIESGGRPSFGVAWRHVQAHAGSLAMASLLVGSLAGLGIFAAILPGLYFMAIYLFVPYLILVEPKAPLSVYFRKSKRLAKENFGKCLAFAMLGFLLSVADLVTADFGLSQSIGTSFGLGIRALIQMSTGLIMDLWVCSFFINLKRRSVEK